MGRKIAYIMSRFPKISETFILYEILELERLGLQVEIFPLLREKEPVMHPEAQALVNRAHYSHLLSITVLTAQIYWLFRRPKAYLRVWWQALYGNLSSKKFILRALAVIPQAALFARKMQTFEVTHIHAHWATHPTLAAYIIKQLTEIPYSFTAHAHDIYVERSMLGEKIRQANFVVTISEYNRQFIQKLYGTVAENKTKVIHCGIDPEVFQPRSNCQKSGFMDIICVARLEEMKGHRYLLEACAQLKDQGIPFRCTLVGDGDLRPQIETQIRQSGLSHHVVLLGHQPRHRVSELLDQASVMVLPSVITATGKKEGIPVALMEALAMEMPVVATTISGIPELIEDGHTGLLVPERDATALAGALHRLYHNPTLGKHLGTAGRTKVLKTFNLRHNTVALYDLLSSHNPDPLPELQMLPHGANPVEGGLQ